LEKLSREKKITLFMTDLQFCRTSFENLKLAMIPKMLICKLGFHLLKSKVKVIFGAGVGTIGSDRLDFFGEFTDPIQFFWRVHRSDPIQFFRRVHRSDPKFFSNVPTPDLDEFINHQIVVTGGL
jgi:hypothetical protein